MLHHSSSNGLLSLLANCIRIVSHPGVKPALSSRKTGPIILPSRGAIWCHDLAIATIIVFHFLCRARSRAQPRWQAKKFRHRPIRPFYSRFYPRMCTAPRHLSALARVDGSSSELQHDELLFSSLLLRTRAKTSHNQYTIWVITGRGGHDPDNWTWLLITSIPTFNSITNIHQFLIFQHLNTTLGLPSNTK